MGWSNGALNDKGKWIGSGAGAHRRAGHRVTQKYEDKIVNGKKKRVPSRKVCSCGQVVS